MQLFYLSFASETVFLGGVIVESDCHGGALAETIERGINPGGEVQIVSWGERPLPGAEWRNRLLTRGEVLDLGRVLVKALH